MKTTRFTRVLLRVLASGALAGLFVVLFANAPFLSQSIREETRTPASRPLVALPVPDGGTGMLPTPDLPGLRGGGQPAFGLFSGHFTGSAGMPGFSMQEYAVQGACEGAGRRYVESVCPGCAVLEAPQQPGQPGMLMWTKPGEEDAVRSVTADCIETTVDGRQVVAGVIVGDGDGPGPAADGSDQALDKVPLLPGGRRLSAVEMGGWLATMDAVTDPETALEAMAAALRRLGWEDAPGQELPEVSAVERQRVFRRDGESTCIIYLSDEGDGPQLVTIMNS